jgi:ABC-type transporter Mla maintaining outer membrane lipid asymmetry ATPase subunit MlaF
MGNTDSDREKQDGAGRHRSEERQNRLVPGVVRWPVDSGEPIIVLEDVHKSFGKDEILKGLSLTVAPGKITIIIGASGSGKSVLIKHMNGLFQPDKGRVCLFGKDVKRIGVTELAELRKRVGTMFQNYALFDSMTVCENVAFPLIESGGVSRGQAMQWASEVLEDLGLGHALDQYPATLSGGMKKRVSLARAIVGNPELVLFDEPTTGLDPVMMEFVDNMIRDITRKYALTSVLISHDLATIFRLADSIAVLHDGQIIAQGPPDAIRASDDERVKKLIGGAGSKADIKADDAASVVFSSEAEQTVRMKGVHKSFGQTAVLRGVDFYAPANKLTVLIGGSGAGKSVMMKHLLGLMRPDTGTVHVFGQDLARLRDRKLRDLRTRIGMLFQHAALFDSMTVRENVAFPIIERRAAPPKEAYARVDRLLEELKLSEIAHESPVAISSGQQKRVSLARALATEPELMIYDEPTTGQDPLMSKYVEDMIVEVQEKFHITSIVISHDMASAFRIADYIAMLHKGEVIAYGDPKTILETEDERVREFVYAADVAEAERRKAGDEAGH